jgi:predicted ATPase/DNA-binding SARP family transcriptional activator
MLEIRTLGGLSVKLDGEPVTQLKTRKVEALLVYLACTTRAHPRETLAELFWEERTQAQSMTNLRGALSSLRRHLGEYLIITRDAVATNLDAQIRLDTAVLEENLSAGQVEEAITLYQGDFLGGFFVRGCPGFEDWVSVERERLHRILLDGLGQAVEACIGANEWQEGITYATHMLQLDPLMEEAHRQLMCLLTFSGQRSAALAQYEACRDLLAQELGVEPEPETIALYEEILAGDLSAPSETTAPPPHNLPLQLTSFVGRETELAELGRLLGDPDVRLVTIVGVGGMGKTRLALEAASAQLDRFEHGVFFVSLAPLPSADGIVPTVANALGLTFSAGEEPVQQLRSYLRRKQMLLMMDNYEHLLEGAGLVSDILSTAPDVKIMATSRARLSLQGEHLLHLSGLNLPEEDAAEDAFAYSAVELFVTSAQRVRTGLELRGQDQHHAVRICRLVEGMPLALVLAAGWIDVLAPVEIAAEIGRGLDFLETDARDFPARLRSMRAVFDQSWRLLSQKEREIMQALSVFRGGFTREAARVVTGATLRDLRGLANKSLLGRSADGRYDVHELLRQYAEEKLGQTRGAADATRNRHCGYYCAALRGWAEDLKGARCEVALAELDREIDNARAAWNWSIEQAQVEQLGHAVEGLCRFFVWRGRAKEGEAACHSAAERLQSIDSSESLLVLASVLAWQGSFCYSLGHLEAARDLLGRSLAVLGQPELADRDLRSVKAFALAKLGLVIQLAVVDHQEAHRLYQESLTLYRALIDRHGIATVLWYLGRIAHHRNNLAEARQFFEESWVIRQSLGDKRAMAMSLEWLGAVALAQGRLEDGEGYLRQCVSLSQEVGYREYVADGLMSLGLLLGHRGEFVQWHSLIQEAMEIHEELGLHVSRAVAPSFLASAEVHLGRYEQARAHLRTPLLLA